MSKVVSVHVPQENVNDEEVVIIAWHAANGERVAEGQVLVELETSKATVEIVSPAAGFVRYTLEEGKSVAVGHVLCTVEPNQVEGNGHRVEHQNVGEADVKDCQPDARGTIISADESRDRCELNLAPAPTTDSTAGKLEKVKDAAAGLPRFSKRARERLTEYGLSEEQFAGQGMVRACDVFAAVASEPGQTAELSRGRESAASPEQPRHGPVAAFGVSVQTRALAPQKQTENRYLRAARETTLPSLVSVTVPTRGFRTLVAQLSGPRQSICSLAVFEVARLLCKYRCFNAYYAKGSVHFYDEVNIGFAVDDGRGLRAPVIRGADLKNAVEIALEMQERLVSYLNNELSAADLTGATFTVTDLSGEGVAEFIPRLNRGQSAILGIGSEVFSGRSPANDIRSPLAADEIGAYKLLLAFDHQVAEGRIAAQFLNDLKGRLQSYEAVATPRTMGRAGQAEPSCTRCLRPAAELADLGAQLLATIHSDGLQRAICTLCIAGF